MLSDIEIARITKTKPIAEITAELGLTINEWEPYGRDKAKLNDSLAERLAQKPDGKLVLVTAINPTPAGEGKTTTTVGLGQSLNRIGKKAIIALREPSLGPVFGMKGGAAGGGYAQVVPMEEINLHFTGDLHAITAANNLLAAMIDNHLQQGNQLGIDPRQISWKRCMDMNDRALRNTIIGLGGKMSGVPREDGFIISVASEIMAILCLASDLQDLKARIKKIVVASTYDGKPVTADDLQAAGAMTALLKEAMKPNLVQTLEGTPALMHGGPFANIAHGCNSLKATKLGLKLADYLVTEAGFGADLGAEKFFDIKCRAGGLTPDAVVLVATIRALKYNGGVAKDKLNEENVQAVVTGGDNLRKHIENIRLFGLPCLVALNVFPTDTADEIAAVQDICDTMEVRFSLSEVFAKGGPGGEDMASQLIDMIACHEADFKPLYSLNLALTEKIETIAKNIYGAGDVQFTPAAASDLQRFESAGYGHLPVCMAKTQYSLSDDPGKLGRPENFTIQVREVKLSAGAGFVVALTGNILTMPGLPRVPAAQQINVDSDGQITGLF